MATANSKRTEKHAHRKTILSFYCDDTSPHTAGPRAFETFLDFCAERGIAGEASAILGMEGHSLPRNPNEEEKAYLAQVRRAFQCGIDTHMEVMTHLGLFDFDADRHRENAIHEGLWMYEPCVTMDEYRSYFADIISEGQRAGVRFTGLTWPGCGCDACTQRYAELKSRGQRQPNPGVWQALLSLAGEGKFRGHTVPCFFDPGGSDAGISLKAEDGENAVYDLMPNAGDHFGIWENNPDMVDPDYYIAEDGSSGAIVDLVRSGAPYCIWYSHWQGLNPATGVGWQAFVNVVDRISRHLHDRVVWMRPSEISDRYHETGGWDFVDRL